VTQVISRKLLVLFPAKFGSFAERQLTYALGSGS